MNNVALAILCIAILIIGVLAGVLIISTHENDKLIGKFKATCTLNGGELARDANDYIICAKRI